MWAPFSEVKTLNIIFLPMSILLTSLRKMMTSSTIPTPPSRDNHLFHGPMGLGHFILLLPFHSPSHINDKHISICVTIMFKHFKLLAHTTWTYDDTFWTDGQRVKISQERPHVERKTDWFLTLLVGRKKCEVDMQRVSAFTMAWYKEHCLKLGKPVSQSWLYYKEAQDLRGTHLACVCLDFLTITHRKYTVLHTAKDIW